MVIKWLSLNVDCVLIAVVSCVIEVLPSILLVLNVLVVKVVLKLVYVVVFRPSPVFFFLVTWGPISKICILLCGFDVGIDIVVVVASFKRNKVK